MYARYQGVSRSAVAGLLFGAALALGGAPTAQAEETIHVAGYGGVTWELITKNFLTPLKEKTGLEVKLETEPSLAKLKAMVEAGRCDFEVIELYGAEYEIAVRDGLLQKIDYSIVDPDNIMPDFAKHDEGFLFVTFSEVDLSLDFFSVVSLLSAAFFLAAGSVSVEALLLVVSFLSAAFFLVGF